MLTTKDNPYDPYKEYDEWLAWDRENEYYTQEYLARIADVSPDMDDAELEQRVDEAIESILTNDTLQIYTIK